MIFVIVAGHNIARAHLTNSISHPVPLSKVEPYFGGEELVQVRQFNADHDGLYAWGAVPGPRAIPTWESMSPGDYVLCVYDLTYHYYAQVLAKYHNSDAAEAIWRKNDDGKTWEYMYFLSKPQKINVHVPDLVPYLNKRYFGFTKIGDKRVEHIEQDYGSVDNFIANRLNAGQPIPITVLADNLQQEADAQGAFDPDNDQDARDRTLRAIVQRRGQPAFRQALIQAYRGRCAITDNDCNRALEAAHIQPYMGEHTNHIQNGLLLRSDIHALYDYGLISIDPDTHTVYLAEELRATAYADLHGITLNLPDNENDRPLTQALRYHYDHVRIN